MQTLATQRRDECRHHLHSRIKQTRHFIGAELHRRLRAAVHRSGHCFFEPKRYDRVNQATHEHEEEIKAGCNLRRKVALLRGELIDPGRRARPHRGGQFRGPSPAAGAMQ
ncbi:MAG: hypothetical protein C0505_18995 [Leptothrix sp. (in: Bacteria)]|nr:hypothetical protein [Leptothrix sp. (in: b-proteobacteria)]